MQPMQELILDSMPPSLSITLNDEEADRFRRGDFPEGEDFRMRLARGDVQSVHFADARGAPLGVWY